MKDFLVNDIKISIIHHCKDNGEVVSIERTVSQNGEIVYSDKQSPNIYFNTRDRISDIEQGVQVFFAWRCSPLIQ